jgi:hypothetical protein
MKKWALQAQKQSLTETQGCWGLLVWRRDSNLVRYLLRLSESKRVGNRAELTQNRVEKSSGTRRRLATSQSQCVCPRACFNYVRIDLKERQCQYGEQEGSLKGVHSPRMERRAREQERLKSYLDQRTLA